MSTPFSKISELMYREMQKSDIYNKMETDVALDVISSYILTSATTDFRNCKKDLELYTPYYDVEKKYAIQTDVNTLSIDISDIEDKIKENVIVYVNDEEISLSDSQLIYSGDNLDINYKFKTDDLVIIKFVFEGEFEEDLNHNEMYIIALGAYYHYLCGKLQDEENFWCKRYGDKDYTFTRGDTKDVLQKDKASVWNNLLFYIKEYENKTFTYEDFM